MDSLKILFTYAEGNNGKITFSERDVSREIKVGQELTMKIEGVNIKVTVTNLHSSKNFPKGYAWGKEGCIDVVDKYGTELYFLRARDLS